MEKKLLGMFTLSQLVLCFLMSCSTEGNQQSTGGQKIIGHRSGNHLYIDENQGIDHTEMRVDTSFNSMEKREVLYIPVYSDIYIRSEDMRIPLTVTLTIRNTSLDKSVFVKTIDYFDSNGILLNKYLNNPIQLTPLQSIWLVVDDKKFGGGTGANFIVDWGAEINCPKPIVEALMTGSSYQLGLSFKSESMVSKSWCQGIEVQTDCVDNPINISDVQL